MAILETKSRQKRLRELLVKEKLDALIVSALPNVRYLSGFTGSSGAMLVTLRTATLCTDPRYEIQAREQANCRVSIEKKHLSTALANAIRKRRIKRVGFESRRMTFADHRLLKASLPEGARLVSTSGIVESVRLVKDASEIELIRRSVQTCSEAFSRAMSQVRPGMREVELAASIDYEMRRLGAECPAFDTIVAAGERTALPHAEPTGKTINNNGLLLIDMGAQQAGYCSDMTRVACLGNPSRKIRELHAAVLESQLAALDAVADGVPAGAVDQAARDVLGKHGLAEAFVHSTGHGLGLEIHEAPRLGQGDPTRLTSGMVITVEPGAYLEGFGGVRIEDTVVVKDKGCEILTPTSKELLVI